MSVKWLCFRYDSGLDLALKFGSGRPAHEMEPRKIIIANEGLDSPARTPRGKRTLPAILNATVDLDC
jgi:hypothetical protein